MGYRVAECAMMFCRIEDAPLAHGSIGCAKPKGRVVIQYIEILMYTEIRTHDLLLKFSDTECP